MKIETVIPVGDYAVHPNGQIDLLRVPQNVLRVSGFGKPVPFKLQVVDPELEDAFRLEVPLAGHRHPNLPDGWRVTAATVVNVELPIR